MKYENLIESNSCNFLKTAFDKLFIYKTPKSIVYFIELEHNKSRIINPPYDTARRK